MAEIMELNETNLEKQQLQSPNPDQFFDAEDGEHIKVPPDDNEDDFLKKIDEAISGSIEPSTNKICLESDNVEEDVKNSLDDIDKLLAAAEEVVEEDALLKDDELIPTNSENELLKELDEDIQNSEANSEFEDILKSVQNGELSDIKAADTIIESQEKEVESKNGELTREDTNENLLELCESPDKNVEEESNESNGDDSNSTKDEKLKEDDGATLISLSSTESSETNQNAEETDSNSQVDAQNSDDKMDENQKEERQEVIIEKNSEESNENVEVPEVEPEKMDTEESTEKESEPATELETETTENINEATEVEDVEMANIEPKVEDLDQKVFVKETSVESTCDEKKPVIEVVKKEEIKVKLNFMKKFAPSLGKLSRNDLEELLLEKITESICFRSECTELRTKCDKQDEIIDNLKQRIQSITKQYNDLDMIHKRIIKDLKDRPDQPITPVKITRAVGLQVYQPHNNNSNNLKQKVTSTTSHNVLNKRPNEEILDREAEAKRKKCNKIITPMRPPLSEKERASLEKQEASIEQKIRTKVIKPDVAAPSSTKPVINGQPAKSSMTQSIDLTDEDDSPMAPAQPPALVAIQKNSFMSPRGVMRANPLVRSSPNVVNRMDPNRMMGGVSRHPAPLPQTAPQQSLPGMKKLPPRPTIKINNVANGIIVSWTVDTLTSDHAEIHSYQIYAYEETRLPPTSESWKHVGDVKALLLPMAVTLTQFQEGQKYHFAVRAVDIHRRIGQFSLPKTW